MKFVMFTATYNFYIDKADQDTQVVLLEYAIELKKKYWRSAIFLYVYTCSFISKNDSVWFAKYVRCFAARFCLNIYFYSWNETGPENGCY